MKLVAEDGATLFTERTAGQKARAAISKMQLSFGETRFKSEKSGHPMANSVGVLKSGAKHHVAPAFAMDRNAPRGGLLQTFAKALASRKQAGMKLGVAARQPDRIGRRIRRLVG